MPATAAEIERLRQILISGVANTAMDAAGNVSVGYRKQEDLERLYERVLGEDLALTGVTTRIRSIRFGLRSGVE